MEMRSSIPKCLLTLLNQIYELEQKLKQHGDPANLSRNVVKMKDAFEDGLPREDGGRFRLVYEDPMGQPFKDTRTDLEASIAGNGTEDLVVVEVVKPIIRAFLGDGISLIVQKGIVIVESRQRAVSP